MSSRRIHLRNITRREWTALLAATPLLAQAPAPSDQKPSTSNDDARKVSQRLAEIEVPMNVEPAFRFVP